MLFSEFGSFIERLSFNVQITKRNRKENEIHETWKRLKGQMKEGRKVLKFRKKEKRERRKENGVK